MPDNPKLTVYPPPHIADAVSRQADHHGQTLSAYALQAIIDRLVREGAFDLRSQQITPAAPRG